MANGSNLLTLKELCNSLSISVATGRNWLKLNKLTPTKTVDNVPYFSLSYINKIKKEISTGKNTALKSRRNKKYVSGNGIYKSYISPDSANNDAVFRVLALLSENNIVLTDEEINLLLAECALQLFCQRMPLVTAPKSNLLSVYLSKELDIAPYSSLIDDLIFSQKSALSFIQKHPEFFSVTYTYEKQEDILGLLYLSLKNIGSRKATGSYYTPTETVHRLIKNLFQSDRNFTSKTVFDPCCGTGNFLLQLPDTFDFSDIYGNDLDQTSCNITQINLALKFLPKDTTILYEHITTSDFLTESWNNTYDYIIGNPPWGFSFSDAEKKYIQENYYCTHRKSVESYDVFTERALTLLAENGTLSFVLPKAILNVKSHAPIRSIILQNYSITYIDFLGDTFDKVQCPCIILQIARKEQPFSCIGMTVTTPTRSFTIKQERSITADCFHFLMDDKEYQIFDKIMNHPNKTTLQNQADFALGIVTGNNKKYLSHQKTASNEVILKGSDIGKYQIKEPENFITFAPENFQQVAPEQYYRAPEKLFYRFISNEPVFAYDDKGRLSLNSCNIVIPHVTGLDMKYILAILNSRITRFIFRKYFDSVKILRSHIEQIPIPVVDSEVQRKIIALVNGLLQESDEKKYLTQYNELDKIIARLFGITEEEYSLLS